MKKVILVSGGSDGLGKAIAQRLSEKHQVIILSPNEGKLKTIAKALNCDYVVCDVADYSDIKKAIKYIIGKYKIIDCLINNAGIWLEGELDDNHPEEIKRLLEVNTLGTIYLTHASLPHFKKRRQGLIINIVSHLGLIGKERRSVYVASKWAISGFTKSLQIELSPYNIGVAGVYPAKMKTSLFAKKGVKKEMADALDPTDVAKTVELIISLGHKVLVTELGVRHLKYQG